MPGGVDAAQLVGDRAELEAMIDWLGSKPDRQVGSGWSRLIWHTESRNVITFAKQGVCQRQLGALASRVCWLAKKKGVEICLVWQTDNTELLRQTVARLRAGDSTDEWGLEWAERIALLQDIGVSVTVDAFASADNKVCDTFFAKVPQPGAAQVDFFAQPLRQEETYYCCPPVKEASRMIRRLERFSAIRAVIVLPYWRNALFWPLLREGAAYRKEVKQVVVRRMACRDFGQGRSVFTRQEAPEFWVAVFQSGKLC